MKRAHIIFLCLAIATSALADDQFGHSKHGTAFDSGMRTKPWKMEGIGVAPFPITTKNKEVQVWYDQGNELLHSFWFEEAERAFRWCHKLEPDNAMVYFGLARCGLTWFSIGAPPEQRYKDFLGEAMKRRTGLPERERLYIEAWDAAWSKTGDDAKKRLVSKLEELCLKYPDDIEAKCQLAFFNIGQGSALANEMIIRDVLKANPMHPGAHHARIHNWDDTDSGQAIDSCELYGKAAPGIGHSLHMPGHIYSKIGMWHDAAIAMDSATRTELRYMNDRLALPFETWNYAHNRDYLCYIQEQLGREKASYQGAMDMIHAPRDPQANGASEYQTTPALLRCLIKFERWDEILDGKTVPTTSNADIEIQIGSAESLALIGKVKFEAARLKLDDVLSKATKSKADEIAKATPEKAAEIRKSLEDTLPLTFSVAKAELEIAEGNRMEGLRLLNKLADEEAKAREKHQYRNDPPSEPWPVMRLIGDFYLSVNDNRLAADAYEIALKQELNDAWCLAGLAKAYKGLGDLAKAKTYAGRFLAVWDGADSESRLSKDVAALNLKAAPVAVTMRPENAYSPKALDSYGPSNWRPFAAPNLECQDVNGKTVKLSDFRGKNVLLVFYLSDQCVHCMEQLTGINGKISDFEKANTVVLAVSSTKPEANKASLALAPFKVTLLSDKDHVNARRFSSYDDFEDIELHSTILIDKEGKVRWKRTGGDPFSNVDFLLTEINRFSKQTLGE